jgi:hypothetical protein
MKTMIKKTILGALLSASMFAQQKLVFPGAEVQVYFDMQFVFTEIDIASLHAAGIYNLKPATFYDMKLQDSKAQVLKQLGPPDKIYADYEGAGTETFVYNSGFSVSYSIDDYNRFDAFWIEKPLENLRSFTIGRNFYLSKKFKLRVGQPIAKDLIDKYWYKVYDEQNKGTCRKSYHFYIYAVDSLSDYFLSICVDSAEKITEIYYGGPA